MSYRVKEEVKRLATVSLHLQGTRNPDYHVRGSAGWRRSAPCSPAPPHSSLSSPCIVACCGRTRQEQQESRRGCVTRERRAAVCLSTQEHRDGTGGRKPDVANRELRREGIARHPCVASERCDLAKTMPFGRPWLPRSPCGSTNPSLTWSYSRLLPPGNQEKIPPPGVVGKGKKGGARRWVGRLPGLGHLSECPGLRGSHDRWACQVGIGSLDQKP